MLLQNREVIPIELPPLPLVPRTEALDGLLNGNSTFYLALATVDSGQLTEEGISRCRC